MGLKSFPAGSARAGSSMVLPPPSTRPGCEKSATPAEFQPRLSRTTLFPPLSRQPVMLVAPPLAVSSRLPYTWLLLDEPDSWMFDGPSLSKNVLWRMTMLLVPGSSCEPGPSLTPRPFGDRARTLSSITPPPSWPLST